MPPTETPDRLWAELWLRRDTYGTYDVQQEVLDRVRALEEEGALGDSTVSGWGKQLLTLERDPRSEALAALDAFEEWADRHGVSLEPAFERRTQSPLLSDESYDVAVFPVVCLALYRGNDVAAVFPCADEEVHTVGECLDALEAGEAEALLDELGSQGPRAAPETAPEDADEEESEVQDVLP